MKREYLCGHPQRPAFQRSSWLIIVICMLWSCAPEDITEISIPQGVMSGEITESTAILQARLETLDSLPTSGVSYTGYFEVSEFSDFTNPEKTTLVETDATRDFIIKGLASTLSPGTLYYYRLRYGKSKQEGMGPTGSFRTLGGAFSTEPNSMVIVTGMNYYHHHYGKYKAAEAYVGADKEEGYPALASVMALQPDYFIGTGDNVYYDHPAQRGFDRATERGDDPHPGGYEGQAVKELAGMRRKFHEQFIQPRFIKLFAQTGTFWMKDDHDYRYNDSDPYSDMPISHELGIRTFQEQLPFPGPSALPYRTHRVNRDLQLWFVEGRDYRSANKDPDGPDKTIWGLDQKEWLQTSLLESNATFKVMVSPTPMVGPDDAYKTDNHTNHQGFRHEGDRFFDWLSEQDFQDKNFYIVCGDRHWQYHAKHPSGIEEFSTGALVDNNARAGRVSGDKNSTDPDGEIEQFYIQGTSEEATGGFLHMSTLSSPEGGTLTFRFYDDEGSLLYKSIKNALRE
ncbi:MAG: alkaline phosphatase D family protein [Saprospiraceae bacterium]|nr:alkaline phosphatase D family protein [Saprospiraceae bacterium]